MKKILVWVVVLSLLVSGAACAAHRSTYSTVAVRDESGRIARSVKARAEFQKKNPCPATGKTTGKCPGYVIDHIVPLKRGGPDDPANMQWQTEEEARLKDQWE